MVMSVFKQLKDLPNLRVKCHTRNRNLEGSNFLFWKGIKIKMVADAKKGRSSFIVYVKQSRSVSSSMFQYNVHYLTHVFQCSTFTSLDSVYIYIYMYIYILYLPIFIFFLFYFLFFYRTITTIKTGYPSLYLKLTYIVEMLDLF